MLRRQAASFRQLIYGSVQVLEYGFYSIWIIVLQLDEILLAFLREVNIPCSQTMSLSLTYIEAAVGTYSLLEIL